MANRILSILAVALFLMGAAAPSSEIEGELEVIVKDFPTHAEHEYSVKDAKGQRHKLRMPASYRHDKPLQSGQKVRVRGKRSKAIGGEFEVESFEVSASITVLPNTVGPLPVLVMVVSYSNQQNGLSAVGAKDLYRTAIDPFMRTESSGLQWLVGDKTVSDPGDFTAVTIALASGGCDYNQITAQAREQARLQGYRTNIFDAYKSFVYFIPSSPCGWNGLATVGGTGGFAIANGEYTCRVICHESLHNRGLQHSRAEPQCLNCGYSEYGDFTDVMGNTSGGIVGAYGRDRLGWVNQQNTPQVPTITQSSDYTIDALDTPGLGVKGIKIGGAMDGTNPIFLYVTYRQTRGQVFVHRGSEFGSYGYLMGYINTPDVGNWSLEPGEVFTLQGITIRTQSISGGTAVINVQLPSVGTLPNAPSTLTVN